MKRLVIIGLVVLLLGAVLIVASLAINAENARTETRNLFSTEEAAVSMTLTAVYKP